MVEFVKKLKEKRLAGELTQEQMAERLGIKLKTYQEYETLKLSSRKIKYEMMMQIADVLDVSVDDLLGRK